MRAYYLDTNVLSRIALDSDRETVRLREGLYRLAVSRHCRVLGSAAQIEEAAGLADQQPQLWERLITYFWRITGHNFIRARRDVMWSELRKSSRPTLGEYFLDTAGVPRLKELSLRLEDARSVFTEGQRGKAEFADTFNRLGEQLVCRVTQARLIKEVRSAGRNDWVIDWPVIQAWFEHWCALYARDVPWVATGAFPNVRTLPCNAAFFLYLYAKARRRLITGETVKENDQYDHAHFVYAAIAGTLVTDDGSFINILTENNRALNVRVISKAEFANEVKNL